MQRREKIPVLQVEYSERENFFKSNPNERRFWKSGYIPLAGHFIHFAVFWPSSPSNHARFRSLDWTCFASDGGGSCHQPTNWDADASFWVVTDLFVFSFMLSPYIRHPITMKNIPPLFPAAAFLTIWTIGLCLTIRFVLIRDQMRVNH